MKKSLVFVCLCLFIGSAFGAAAQVARAGQVCLGDCNEDGTINFDDLVAILFEFGNTPGNGCDADANGSVNFNDLVAALFGFGPCPELVRTIDYTSDLASIDFVRGTTTRDRDGVLKQPNEPRLGRPKLRVGDVTVERLTPNTPGEDFLLASGMSADGSQNILVRRVDNPNESPEAYLDVFVGDELVLINDGAPAITSGYGYKQVAGNHWFRYAAELVGVNRSSPFHFNLEDQESVWDWGDSIPQFRTGAGSFEPNALVVTPYFGTAAWGLVGLQLRANRYISGSGTNASYSCDGIMSAFWQFPDNVNDPSDHWTIGRGESDFTGASNTHNTGIVAHDLEPGRARGAELSRHNPSTPGRRSSERPSVLAFSSDDYMLGTNTGGDTAPGSALTMSQLVLWDSVQERWDLSRIYTVDFEDDFTSNPLQRHGHSSILIAVNDGGPEPQTKLALCTLSADDPIYSGVYARVLEEPWDPDAPSAEALARFEDRASWSGKIWLLGKDILVDPSVAAGQRLMCPRQAPSMNAFFVGSDDRAAPIRKITWADRASPPRVEHVSPRASAVRQYSFDLLQSRPTDPATKYFMWVTSPDFVDRAGDGRAALISDGDELFGFSLVPHLDSATADRAWAFGHNGRMLYSGPSGILYNEWPVTQPVTPLVTARGVRDVMATSDADMNVSQFGTPTLTLGLSRGMDGHFSDPIALPALSLPRDPGESPLAVRFDMTVGNEAIGLNVFDRVATRSGLGSLGPDQSQRTFVIGTLLVVDGWPADPIAPFSLFARIIHAGADAGNQVPQNSTAQLPGIATNIFSVQDTERWTVSSHPYPHGWNGSSPADVGLRLRMSTNGVLTRSRFYTTVINAYEGRGWPGYPTGAGFDATAYPESVVLNWPVEPGSVVFGNCFISEAVDASLFPMYVHADDNDPADLHVPAPQPSNTSGEPWALNDAEGEMVLCEIGDPTGDDFLSLSVVFNTAHTAGEIGPPLIRVRGRVAGGSEVISDTTFADPDGRFAYLFAQHQLTWAIHVDANGPWATCSSMGTRVSTPPVTALAGLPTMILAQDGADIANPAHAIELERDFITVLPEALYGSDELQFSTFSAITGAK